MFYINIQRPRDKELLEKYIVSLINFENILSTVKQANDSYYHLSQKHEHFYKMLSSSDMMLNNYLVYRKMPLKEKQEWLSIKNLKTGDRGSVNRHLISELKQVLHQIYTELIEPRLSAQAGGNQAEALELSDEIDSLLLGSSVPAYFKYLEKLAAYKKGVFNPLKRGYISFIQIRALNVISQFLKTFEQDLTVLDNALLNEAHLKDWPRMGDIVSGICDRADPNHHDPLSLHAVNCLRSIYISVYNIAMVLLQLKKDVPIEIRQFLPLIPDKLDFTKTKLEYDNAWNRYQDHHFLFMRLPKEQKARLGECLSNLTPAQRVLWMGCLGKEEIRALVLPMISQSSRFENLAKVCREIPYSDSDNYPFGSRIWEILGGIYTEYLMKKESTSIEIHQLFDYGSKDSAAPIPEEKPAVELPAPVATIEEADLSAIQDLSFLVVDDSDRIRQMTTKVLKDAGVKKISESVNGAEAWKLLQQQPVDVVLCDWIMPELTGIELVQKIMQIESLAQKTTFLMLTTVNDKASIVEALSVGVRGYLIKPFSRKQLLEKVFFATEWLRKEQQSGRFSTKRHPKKPTSASARGSF